MFSVVAWVKGQSLKLDHSDSSLSKEHFSQYGVVMKNFLKFDATPRSTWMSPKTKNLRRVNNRWMQNESPGDDKLFVRG